MEKTIVELEKEKEEVIANYNELIRQAVLRRVQKDAEEAEIRRAKIQEREDEGWNSAYINPHQPAPEPIIVKKPEKIVKHTHPHPEPPKVPEDDPKDAEIRMLREKLAAKEAEKEETLSLDEETEGEDFIKIEGE